MFSVFSHSFLWLFSNLEGNAGFGGFTKIIMHRFLTEGNDAVLAVVDDDNDDDDINNDDDGQINDDDDSVHDNIILTVIKIVITL